MRQQQRIGLVAVEQSPFQAGVANIKSDECHGVKVFKGGRDDTHPGADQGLRQALAN
jgi:hypothetical protein